MIATGNAPFRKSSYSGATNDCVEVGSSLTPAQAVIGVRDSKIEDSPVFTVAPSAWSAFLTLTRS